MSNCSSIPIGGDNRYGKDFLARSLSQGNKLYNAFSVFGVATDRAESGAF
jgi:hypothetical protein